jgi:pimeloyl-ACP methyl ester carboxylesterase
MEQAIAPAPDGNFLWHMGFQSVPDLPELLIAGKEKPYLRWFFEHFAYDPGAITAADLDEYVDAITQAVAPAASGGVIERCGHWAAEERPEFVADIARELAASR